MAKYARQLRKLEADARKLLAKVGKFGEDYDSARLMSALGHVASAVEDLRAAAAVREAQERHD